MAGNTTTEHHSHGPLTYPYLKLWQPCRTASSRPPNSDRSAIDLPPFELRLFLRSPISKHPAKAPKLEPDLPHSLLSHKYKDTICPVCGWTSRQV